MNDPLYKYEKGSGWVLDTFSGIRSPTYTDISGRKFHIEVRDPKDGEVYGQSTLPPVIWEGQDWEVTLKGWVEHFKLNRGMIHQKGWPLDRDNHVIIVKVFE